MGNRYLITGVQMALLLSLDQKRQSELLQEILKEQSLDLTSHKDIYMDIREINSLFKKSKKNEK